MDWGGMTRAQLFEAGSGTGRAAWEAAVAADRAGRKRLFAACYARAVAGRRCAAG